MVGFGCLIVRTMQNNWEPRGGVMISKIVPLEQLWLGSGIETHRVTHIFDLVPNLSYVWKITTMPTNKNLQISVCEACVYLSL